MARGPLPGLTRTAVALVAAAVTSGAMTACAARSAPTPATGPTTTRPTTTRPTTTRPRGTAPAAGTPDATALAVARAWFAWDTRIDARPNDTARRLALPLLAPALRSQVGDFAGDGDPGAEWAEWVARHASAGVEATLGGDDHPPDTAGVAWRQVLATITLHGDGGWTRTVRRTVFVQLDLVDGHWLAADLRAASPG